MTGTPTNKLNEQRKSSNLKFIHKTPISVGYKPIINDPKELRFEYLLIVLVCFLIVSFFLFLKYTYFKLMFKVCII